MTRDELAQHYWRYYLLLEKRFIETIDFAELNTDNYNVYSNTYALLMQAIGAELDTMFKIYCGFGTDERKSISDYAKIIYNEENNIKPQHAIEYPFKKQKIVAVEYDIIVEPFKEWDINKPAQSLEWWLAFDSLKHNRFESRTLANQKNTINILGALFYIEMKMLKKLTEETTELDIFNTSSRLFTLKSWSTRAIPLGDAFGVLGEMFEKGDDFTPKAFDA